MCVESKREHEGTGVVEKNRRFYISSRQLTAEQAILDVRGHWQIENGLHYVLDVTFKEDCYRARKQNAANGFILIQHFAVNLLYSAKDREYSLKRSRRLCDYNRAYREDILSRIWE